MRIIDRYILKSVFKIFLTCLFTFLFLYIIIDIFANLDDILKQKVAIDILFKYYLTYLPIIFVQVSPIACLIATLYTFGILNRNNEIIALRSSGLSIFQISRTIIILAFLISIFVFWVNDKITPSSLALNQRIKEEMESPEKQEKRKKEEINNLAIYGLKNRLYFISKFHPDSRTMEGITILEHDENQNIIKKIVSNKGVYKNRLWHFYQTITYNFDKTGGTEGEPNYSEEEIMAIPETPEDFLAQRQKPDYMTINELDDYIWKLSKSGATTVIRNLKVDLYQRFTMPFTSLVIVFLGIPFALKMKKRATGLSSLGISMMMGFLYYVMTAVSIALGKAGILTPVLSASLSHILAFFFGLYLISSLP